MIHDRLKQIIFKKLYEDLSHVEIIPHDNSIWFIDREEKYWYFEYEKPDKLWWRWDFFSDFFILFSMEPEEFKWVLSEWVEEVLNCGLNTPIMSTDSPVMQVEEVLNCKVKTPDSHLFNYRIMVEEVLNCEIKNSNKLHEPLFIQVGDVLNCKVKTPYHIVDDAMYFVERVLNCKVKTPYHIVPIDRPSYQFEAVEEVLNCKVKTTDFSINHDRLGVEEALKPR